MGMRRVLQTPAWQCSSQCSHRLHKRLPLEKSASARTSGWETDISGHELEYPGECQVYSRALQACAAESCPAIFTKGGVFCHGILMQSSSAPGRPARPWLRGLPTPASRWPLSSVTSLVVHA